MITSHTHCTATDDLQEVFRMLIEVAAYWFTVGVFLRVPYYMLEAIKRDHRDQSMECLSAMLTAWLKETDASPATLVQALKAAGMPVLARKTAVKYGKSSENSMLYTHIIINF